MPERPDRDTARDRNVDDDAYNYMAQEAWQERESLAEALRLSWQEEGADPLLATLADPRQQRLRLPRPSIAIRPAPPLWPRYAVSSAVTPVPPSG